MKKPIILCCVIFFLATQHTFAKGYALLIGANMIKPAAYTASYSTQAVKGAHTDVLKMQQMLLAAGFSEIKTLIGIQVKRSVVFQQLLQIKNSLKDGDVFVFYFSGHGDTLRDNNNDELPYTFDQVFVTYDSLVVDDELNKIWKLFPVTVKIYQVVDACYSGEMYKVFTPESAKGKVSTKSKVLVELGGLCSGFDGTQSFNMYYISAAAKDRTAIPFSNGEGVLTEYLTGLYHRLNNQGKLKLISADDVFHLLCSSDISFLFIRIYPSTNLFSNDYLFKL